MASTRVRTKSRRQPLEFLQKPRGVIHPRVQQVGPEHFGIVSIDCAKSRSKWMLADFYGNVFVPPTFAKARPLEERLRRQRRSRKPQPLAEALVIVLARLGVGRIQSTESGERDLT